MAFFLPGFLRGGSSGVPWLDLEGTILEGAILGGTMIEGAILEGAILEGATLERATLEGATLLPCLCLINWMAGRLLVEVREVGEGGRLEKWVEEEVMGEVG